MNIHDILNHQVSSTDDSKVSEQELIDKLKRQYLEELLKNPEYLINNSVTAGVRG